MARHKSKTLTDGELRVMSAVWKHGEASVKQVASDLQPDHPTAYNTVQTMLNILTDKGYLARRKDGRAFIYEPLVTKASARTQALKHLTQQFFGGSRTELLHNLISDDVDPSELSELRDLLDRADQEGDPE